MGFFCADVFLHQLRNDFVLLDQSLFELGDAPILGRVVPPAAGLPLTGRLGLVQDQLDPPVDLTGLNLRLVGALRNRLPADQVPADNLRLLLGGSVFDCPCSWNIPPFGFLLTQTVGYSSSKGSRTDETSRHVSAAQERGRGKKGKELSRQGQSVRTQRWPAPQNLIHVL
jgi:hypothetical protein